MTEEASERRSSVWKCPKVVNLKASVHMHSIVWCKLWAEANSECLEILEIISPLLHLLLMDGWKQTFDKAFEGRHVLQVAIYGSVVRFVSSPIDCAFLLHSGKYYCCHTFKFGNGHDKDGK